MLILKVTLLLFSTEAIVGKIAFRAALAAIPAIYKSQTPSLPFSSSFFFFCWPTIYYAPRIDAYYSMLAEAFLSYFPVLHLSNPP